MSSMTLEQAVKKAQSLDFAARENWPMGMPADLRAQAVEVLWVITAHELAVPPDEAAAWAASIKAKIDGKVFRAGVAPRKTA